MGDERLWKCVGDSVERAAGDGYTGTEVVLARALLDLNARLHAVEHGAAAAQSVYAKDERAAIVAWLRSQAGNRYELSGAYAAAYSRAAHAIERGDHRQESR